MKRGWSITLPSRVRRTSCLRKASSIAGCWHTTHGTHRFLNFILGRRFQKSFWEDSFEESSCDVAILEWLFDSLKNALEVMAELEGWGCKARFLSHTTMNLAFSCNLSRAVLIGLDSTWCSHLSHLGASEVSIVLLTRAVVACLLLVLDCMKFCNNG